MLSLFCVAVVCAAILGASAAMFNALNERSPLSWAVLLGWSIACSYFAAKASIISGTILFGFALHFPVVFFAGLCFLMIKE